jgi:hypothetical protein
MFVSMAVATASVGVGHDVVKFGLSRRVPAERRATLPRPGLPAVAARRPFAPADRDCWAIGAGKTSCARGSEFGRNQCLRDFGGTTGEGMQTVIAHVALLQKVIWRSLKPLRAHLVAISGKSPSIPSIGIDPMKERLAGIAVGCAAWFSVSQASARFLAGLPMPSGDFQNQSSAGPIVLKPAGAELI